MNLRFFFPRFTTLQSLRFAACLGALALAVTSSLGCAAEQNPSSSGDGGSGGGEGGQGGQGGGGSSTEQSWDAYCDDYGAHLETCTPGTNYNIAKCKREGQCFQPILNPAAVQPYFDCQLSGCGPKNCFEQVGAALPATATRQTYQTACQQQSNCDGVDGIDWDWCSSDFAWKVLSDEFLQQMTPCFSEASCADVDLCLHSVVDGAFASCK